MLTFFLLLKIVFQQLPIRWVLKKKKNLQSVRLSGSGPKRNYFSEMPRQQVFLKTEKNEAVMKCKE